jgi:hypothetical protein
MNTIQGSQISLQLSPDNGVTWKDLVCLETYNLPLQTTVTETETFCGVAIGLGQVKFTPSGQGVCETAPTTNQVTIKDLQAWQIAKTKLLFRSQYPQTSGAGGSMGSIVSLNGNCYVTATQETFATVDVVKFTFTLSGQGVPSQTPL